MEKNKEMLELSLEQEEIKTYNNSEEEEEARKKMKQAIIG